MKKKNCGKLLALLSAMSVAASSMSLTALAEDIIGDEYRTKKIVPLSVEEISDGGIVSYKYYNADGTLYDPRFDLETYLSNEEPLASAAPSKYDLRTLGLSTPVRDQGATGTCWAHSAAASTESNMLKNGMGTANLSERHLAWFVNGTYDPNKSNRTYGDGVALSRGTGIYGAYGGDSGAGNMKKAAAKLASWEGFVNESRNASLVTTGNPSVAGVSESYRYVSDVHVQNVDMVPDYYEANSTVRNLMKNLLMDKGALSVSYYDDDIYMGSDGAYYSGGIPSDDKTYYQINHAVTLIGWDDNYSRTNFNSYSGMVPSTNGAWIIKNSWGTDAGDNGYFYISYEEPLRDIASFQAEPKNNCSKVYQYDSQYGTLFGIAGQKVAAAHIFTAEEDCTISAAGFGFYNSGLNIPYTVRVFKGVSGSNPSSGTLAVQESGTVKYPGYHTHKLSKGVSVKKGETFSVVVSLNTTNSYFWVDDYCYGSGESFITTATAFSSATQWDDTSEVPYTYYKTNYSATGVTQSKSTRYGDVCVKAYTKGTGSSSVPAKPANLKLTSGNGKIVAQWDAVSGASSYVVYTYLNGKYTKYCTTSYTKCNISGLRNGTRYGVLVRASNSAGQSAFTASDVKYATPTAGVAVPAKPANVTLTPGDGKISVQWSEVSGADNYVVYTYLNGKYTKYDTFNKYYSQCTITGLKNGTRYGVLVRASNSAGQSAFTASDVKYATPGTAPSNPANFVALCGDNCAVLQWDAVSGAAGYEIWCKIDGESDYTLLGTISDTEVTVNNLQNDVDYWFKVCAYNSYGKSSGSFDYETPRHLPTPTIKQDSIYASKDVNGVVHLKWDYISLAKGYELVITDSYGNSNTFNYDSSTWTDTISGLTVGETYTFSIRAFRDYSYSDRGSFVYTAV